MAEGVSTASPHRGKQMATKQPKAMASRITNPSRQGKCRRNIWVRQALKENSPAQNKNRASALGTAVAESEGSAGQHGQEGAQGLLGAVLHPYGTAGQQCPAGLPAAHRDHILTHSHACSPVRMDVNAARIAQIHAHLKAEAEDAAGRCFRCLSSSSSTKCLVSPALVCKEPQPEAQTQVTNPMVCPVLQGVLTHVKTMSRSPPHLILTQHLHSFLPNASTSGRVSGDRVSSCCMNTEIFLCFESPEQKEVGQ